MAIRNMVTLCLFSAFMTVVYGQLTNVTIKTSVGDFVGFKENVSVDGSTVQLSKFLGIPYAEPPVGDLRFQKPVPKANMTEPLLVQKYGTECIQVGMTSIPASEDCLFLNIYAPYTTDNVDPLAVMIWIHGGGYVFGSANTYVGDILAARGDVIVVTINYRLAVLGFLNVGDGPSNFGLWDQHLAIQWVHTNIEAFGGDKDRVTIFGESAGAGSVIFQGLYPGNRGLFKRIIAESGTASAPWSESSDPRTESLVFADIVGCNKNTSSYRGVLECLKRLSGQTINEALNDLSNGLFSTSVPPFVPSVDNDFVKLSPKDILDKHIDVATIERSVLASFDLMIGANAAEGAGNVSPVYAADGNVDNFLPNRSLFEQTLIPALIDEFSIQGDPIALAKLIGSTYTTWADPEDPRNIRMNFVDMYGDFLFMLPVLRTTELYAQLSDKGAFMYYFNAKPSVSLFPTPSWVNAPNHGDELFYVFGEVNRFDEWASAGPFEDWEKELSKYIMTMWTNFAKTGNPNQPNNIGINWNPYTSASKRYLEIGRTMIETMVKENLALDRLYLWDQLIPTVNKALDVATMSCDVSGSPHTWIYGHQSSMYIYIVVIALLRVLGE